MDRLIRAVGGAIAAIALAALLASPTIAPAATGPQPSSWTKLLDRPLSASQLGLPATAPAKSLARASLRRSARQLGLRSSLRGLRLLPEVRAPRVAGARDLRTLRYQQTVGGLRVLYSQIDVAVVDGSVTSISATTIPLKSTRLRGAKRISAAQARAIARRRIAGPDSALPAQPIADAGTPGKPRAPRRAWVVQVTPVAQTDKHADTDRNQCVVIDADSGKVLGVWEGVAARPVSARKAAARRSAPAARAAQATETTLFRIRDAEFVPGTMGSTSFALGTMGNPFLYGDDVESFVGHNFPHGAGILPEAGKLSIDMQFLPRHMCLVRGFCGSDGGFDGTYNTLFITTRAPGQSTPPKNDRGTRYVHSQKRVYMESGVSGSGDILAHEFGHLMDHTYGGDRVQGFGEEEEALADMYAYDYDRNDATLGESEPGFTGTADINWANPGAITNPVEHKPYPAHFSQFKCNRTDPHFNGTIYSHAYFRFVQKVGHDKAGAVLHRVSATMGPILGSAGLPDAFIQRAGELFGTSTRNAARAAWTEVGLGPDSEVRPQGEGCFID